MSWSKITFSFVNDFLEKTEIPFSERSLIHTFDIPAISSITRKEGDLLLCPVRAVKEYLLRTRTRRPTISRLFLPIIGQGNLVTKNSISSWIFNVVNGAYGLTRLSTSGIITRIAI